jgi:hypothetical protein
MEPKIALYTIAYGPTTGELAKQVNELIKDGWRPIGGVAVAKDYEGEQGFLQAMVIDKP